MGGEGTLQATFKERLCFNATWVLKQHTSRRIRPVITKSPGESNLFGEENKVAGAFISDVTCGHILSNVEISAVILFIELSIIYLLSICYHN